METTKFHYISFITIFLLLPGIILLSVKESESQFFVEQYQGRFNEMSGDSAHWNNSIPCLTCHVLNEAPGDQLTAIAGNANLCMSCHNPVGMASNTPFTNADRAEPGISGTSHAWNKPVINEKYGAGFPSDPGMAEKVMYDEIVCSTCHNPHVDNYSPFLRTSNDQDAMCKDCHSVRDVGNYNDDPNNKGSHPVGTAYPGSDPRFYATPQNPDIILIGSQVECSSCHGVHYTTSGNANGGTGDGYLLRTSNDDNLCTSCHTYSSHQGMGCLKCHQPHNTNLANIYMIRDTVDTPSSGLREVVFTAENGSNSFADGDVAYNGICEVCHTSTDYHRNNSSGDHLHNTATNCMACHPHSGNLEPQGGCTDCHSSPQAGRRQIVGTGGDFEKSSHHVSGNVQDSDCIVCHNFGSHKSGVVKLKDPDNSNTVYDFSSADPAGIENFCVNCHDADGALEGNGTIPFSDGHTVPNVKGVSGSLWENSAHNAIGYSQNSGNPISCFGNGSTSGCHGNGHGSDNVRLLSAPGGQSIGDFCYNCHTNGLITNNALAGGANDIEEAFGQSQHHNLGITFTESGNNFTLECSSCHNPHIVTGKHWDVESGVSPVSRPDFSDPVNNPRAMGTTLWGDEPGEKMQDFAAQASGSGGFYRKTAQGYALGSTGLPADQAAYYTPPKTGTDFEFEGDVLPDYTTLCLDCHSYKMSSSVGPVNWGQGIPTGHPEPPGPGYVNWVATSSPHGLNSANTSSYISDDGTPGHWGVSGNTDVLFDMNYVTRGRHNGHFMRWPYETADRGAGINFVLSCTDCHEAHGSGVSSMLRSTVNNGPGTPIWNNMCNNCHYYYGGQHIGMSCGNASCHEANSIHRIKKNGGGGGTQLMLTSAGYQDDYVPPDFTPEIISAIGNIGSNDLAVTFRASQYGAGQPGIYTNRDFTGAIEPDDFWLIDKSNDNPRTISSVTHNAGDLTATVIMSAPLTEADLDSDVLATTGKSIWGWYEGGYNNWGTGIVPAQEVSSGPWPFVITPSVELVKGEGAISYDQIYVEFSSAVYANSDATGDLQPSDFTLTDIDNGRTIVSVQHTAGESIARLTLNSNIDDTDDIGTDAIAAAANSIYNIDGFPLTTNQEIIVGMPAHYIASVEGAVGSAKLQLMFSEFVFTNNDISGALQPSDFILTDNDNSRTIISVDHFPGANNAILTLSSALDNSNDISIDEISAAGGSLFNQNGYPVPTDSILAITGQVADSIVAVTGAVGYDKLEVRFSGAVYSNPGQTGTLQPSDFILTDTDNSRTIIAVDHTLGVENPFQGEDIAWLTLSSALDDTDDLSVDMLAVTDVYNYLDNLVDTVPVIIEGMPATIIDSVEGYAGSSILKVTFSHWVFSNNDATGDLQPADFVLTDVNSDNPRTITSVQHSAGDAIALLTMSAPLIATDIDIDLVGAEIVSVFNSAAHPVPTTPDTIIARTAPQITSVEGTVGLNQLLVFFTEGVYTGTGQSGALLAADFILTDIDDGRTILSVEHEAGTSAAILTLSSVLDGSNDIGVDELNAVSNEIFNQMDDHAGTGPVTITGNDCPVGGAMFNFDEVAGSLTITDNSGLLIGTVGNPSFSMLGDGLYTGDSTEAEMTYVDVDNNNMCLKSPRTLSLESRFYMGDIDLDYVDTIPSNNIDDDYDAGGPFSRDGDGRNTTVTRIAERKRTFQFTIMRSNWSGDEIESRAETGRVMFKYRVTDRGYCDGSYPGDPTVGDGSWTKQISSDESFPLVTGHWYKVRIVFNTEKSRLAVNIFADDQGTDGTGSGELWSGYKNITQPDPEESAGCKWAALPGLDMATEDQYLYIGDNPTHVRPGSDDQGDYRNAMLKGKIDWFSWKPVADYSGLDDPPY